MSPIRQVCLVLGLAVLTVANVFAADDDLDNAKWKIDANAWISAPTGNFQSQSGKGNFDLQRDFGFGNYATFFAKTDWRFKRKHHLLLGVTPVLSSRTTTLSRTITWEDETYDVGAKANADVRSLIITPCYQYDIFRRRTWSLGFQANLNVIYTDASLKLVGTVSGPGGSGSGSQERTGTFFAPLPAIGPVFHWYPVPSRSRIYVTGAITGMSFFGYGNFYSGNAVLGIPVSRSLDIRAGYLLGSRLKITGSNDQIGLRLTQKGPVVGVEYHWGIR